MEREAKYLLQRPSEDAEMILNFLDRAEFQVGSARECLQVDRYYDTANWDLLGKQWAFRVRSLPTGGGCLALKSFGDQEGAVHRREEIEQVIDGVPNSVNELPLGRQAIST